MRAQATDNRRNFLRAAALAGFPFLHARLSGQSALPGLITREREPQNLEFPFGSLDSYLTPNERFYVRCHFRVPNLDRAAYKLRVEGAVERPFEINLEELRKLEQRTVTATLECAGNSRVLLVPPVPGAQWEQGAVSNAEWTGVPLSALLDRAGAKTDAVDVVLEGADKGEPRTEPKPPGTTTFFRSIPIAKARKPEVLIALAMNGKELPVSHGFPVRAIVPGYYGMSSVKWLTRIQVLAEPHQGYWQTTEYAYWDRSGGTPVRRPLRDMRIKSLIARPALHELVRAGASYRVFGAAWTGDADVNKVEVSVDGGKTWVDAPLTDKPVRFAWRRWEYDWRAPAQPGPHTLLSRATDSLGHTQPATHNRDTGNYAIHHVLPVEVEIV
jgi:DMSO/TMAO reductase YedYZ molybdopterin-dependent catalytic subunit